MQTLFDIKTRLPIDVDVFEEMRKMAEAELSSNTEAGKYTQAVVLLSAKGNKYRVRIQNALSEEKEQETSLFERMRNLNDTEIYYVLCMWQDKYIDIP